MTIEQEAGGSGQKKENHDVRTGPTDHPD
jgi:hypothetical protein